MHYFSWALSELQVIARNCDWFIALSAPVVIGRSNCFDLVFRQSFENRSKRKGGGYSSRTGCFQRTTRKEKSVDFLSYQDNKNLPLWDCYELIQLKENLTCGRQNSVVVNASILVGFSSYCYQTENY